MSGKRKLITLGKIDKKFLLIFAAIVIRGISELTVEMKFTESSSTNIDNVITIGIYSLGLFLSFPLFIAYRIINRKNKENNGLLSSFNQNNINHVISKYDKIKSIVKKFLWVLLISVVDFGSAVFNYTIFTPSIEITFITIIINAIFMNFAYFWVFKIKLYKHHYTSIIVFAILAILMFIIDFIIKVFDTKKISYSEYLETTFYLILEFALTFFSFILEKYFMVKTYVRLYEYLFVQGIIELILSAILISVLTKLNLLADFSHYWAMFKNEEGRNVALIFIFCVYYSILFLVIDVFTPFHVVLIYLFQGVLFLLYNGVVLFHENKIYLVYSIFISFCLFFIFVYLEIIELNFWGLSRMIKKNIELRAQIEQEIKAGGYDDEVKNGAIPFKEGYMIKLRSDTMMEMSFVADDSRRPSVNPNPLLLPTPNPNPDNIQK